MPIGKARGESQALLLLGEPTGRMYQYPPFDPLNLYTHDYSALGTVQEHNSGPRFWDVVSSHSIEGAKPKLVQAGDKLRDTAMQTRRSTSRPSE